MKFRFAEGFLALALLLGAPVAMAQANVSDPSQEISALPLVAHRLDSPSIVPVSNTGMNPVQSQTKPKAHSSSVNFVLLSTAVYGAAFADMYQTLQMRKNSWWHEADPFARPFIKLPAPAYYATGMIMATGLNWFSWKMAHSHRLRKLAPIPQLLAVTGNLNGFRSNIH